jgi:hypothetical protein
MNEINLTFDEEEWKRIREACAINARIKVEDITDDTVKNMVIFQCCKTIDSYVRYTPVEREGVKE